MFKKIAAWKGKRQESKPDAVVSSSASTLSSHRGSLSTFRRTSATDTTGQSVQESTVVDPGPLGLNVVYTPDNGHKADIVFVHGLGGTSRWTWSNNRDPELFWPLTFLPLEPDLCLARILTFGYDASFQKTGSITTSVLDFAKDLLFDLKYAKDQGLNDLNMGSVPIIFVVHSMGGLIVKEAYMQGQHDPEFEEIIKAVCAITFLATPHRGTNLAQTLNRILDAIILTNSKQYVADLMKNSLTLQKLNEQFRHIAPKLDIVSFYETLPTSIGLKNARVMVLEKDSSVLGYPGEVSKAMNADHHGVCKYDGPEDPNYITMRNILKSLVSKIISKNNARKPSLSDRRALLHLRTTLALPDLPSTDYIFFRDRWTEGTNDWILHDEDFLGWRDAIDHQHHILWLSGDAATGKSVMASFVVNSLIESGQCCQYFFIRYGDGLKRTTSLLLRSLAFQLAQTVSGLMEKITDLLDEALDFESADARILWDRIFKSIIFKLDEISPVYWIIDGLDESEDPRALVRLLMDISSSLPIRVFVTSRRSSEIISAFEQPPQHVSLRTINIEGHIEDLRQHIRRELRVPGTSEVREDIEKRIIEASQNNFLWVGLAIDKVNQCHTHTDIDSVLQDFPVGMEAIYDRMASSVVELPSARDRMLATRIIQCITCSLRPLSIDELTQALGGIVENILDLPRTVVDLCGGFIIVDNDGNANLVHQTAREYLLNDRADRPLQISRGNAHKQMFLDTMRCLMSNNLRVRLARDQNIPFVQYAVESWSSHLVHATYDDNDCVTTLKKFLTGRWALTWIHALAISGNLRVMVQSSRNLSRFVSKRRQRYTGAGFLEQELFENWSVDMLRIPGKFGHVLRRKPDAIYTFIPPFCPKSSPIHQQFGKKNGLSISGLSTEKWDDLIARISLGTAFTSAIDAAGSQVAILTSSGKILLYDPSDFRESATSPLDHSERVQNMQLNNNATLLATYGYRTLKIWKVSSGECIRCVESLESRARPLSMRFSNDNSTLLVGTDDRRVRSLNLSEPQPTWQLVAELEEEDIEGQFANSPSHIALSHDGTMAAVGYRRYPVSAWELDGAMHISHCRRKNDGIVIREIRTLFWHPHLPEVLALNFEGSVFKWAPYDDEVDEISTGATQLCISGDGELFATGDGHGRIRLYTTAHFTLLSQLTSQDAVFSLTFSPDSRRLYDIRGYHANAWEPSALVKFKVASDTNSDSPSEYDASLATGVSGIARRAVDPITALSQCPVGRLFCSGSSRGVLSLHDVRRGKLSTIYASRAKFTVEQIAWSIDSKLLCFTNASKQITLMSVKYSDGTGNPEVEQQAVIPMRQFASRPISQLLFEPASSFLLVCNASQVHIISLKTFSVEHSKELDDTETRRWTVHPENPTLVVGIGPLSIQVLDWNLTLHQKIVLSCPPGGFDDDCRERHMFNVDKVIVSHDKRHILLQMTHSKHSSRVKFFFLETKRLQVEGALLDLEPINEELSSNILTALTLLRGDRLVFISKWFSVSSVRLSWISNEHKPLPATQTITQGASQVPTSTQSRHNSKGNIEQRPQELFALPGDWISNDCLSICAISEAERTFVCPRNGEVAMVRCTDLV